MHCFSLLYRFMEAFLNTVFDLLVILSSGLVLSVYLLCKFLYVLYSQAGFFKSKYQDMIKDGEGEAGDDGGEPAQE